MVGYWRDSGASSLLMKFTEGAAPVSSPWSDYKVANIKRFVKHFLEPCKMPSEILAGLPDPRDR